MVTVMSWHNSEGTKGRCDAKCHNAETPATDCKCMCGGRYHGTARQGTFDAVRQHHGRQILQAAKAQAKRQGLELRSHDRQPSLF